MSSAPSTLSAGDYAVFGVTLGVSALVGIFYAIKDRNAKEDEYMMGGRKLSMVPVSLSLSVSFMSAVTVLGTPAEVYRYGTMYWWFLLAMLIVALITAEIFIPVFYRLGISSTYEYLEKRFSKTVRVLGTLTFILENILYGGIVMYAPSLALSQVTDLSLWLAVVATGVVCTFYTTLGGLKAVIWTDVFQAIIMLAGFLAVTIKGSIETGGFANAWQTCAERGRIDFVHFEFDPRIRHTFWTITVGGTFLWLGIYGVSQSMVQRYLACKTMKQAKGALLLNWLGLVVIISLCCMNGVVMFAYYADCDPLTTGDVSAPDQLLPLFSLALFKNLPGLTGLVISCVFSGSLSTVSSGINAMACVTVEDFIKPMTKWKSNRYIWASKIAVIVYGGLSLAMAYLASQLGGVLEAALSILGLVGGPLVGLFTLGFIFPFVNSWGAGVGLLSGLGFACWVYVGSKVVGTDKEFLRELSYNVSGDNCNFTMPEMTTQADLPPIVQFYSISYAYYSCLGFAAVLVVGILVSFISCGWRQRTGKDPRLFFFLLDHWLISSWLPEKYRKWARFGIAAVDPDVDYTNRNNFKYGSETSYPAFPLESEGPRASIDGTTNVNFATFGDADVDQTMKSQMGNGSLSKNNSTSPPRDSSIEEHVQDDTAM